MRNRMHSPIIKTFGHVRKYLVTSICSVSIVRKQQIPSQEKVGVPLYQNSFEVTNTIYDDFLQFFQLVIQRSFK
jgi:hypothetical protein